MQILLLLKCSGVVLLFWMGLVPSIWKQPYLIMGVSLVRLALMNAGYPVQKSILMDYVPRVSLCSPVPTTSISCRPPHPPPPPPRAPPFPTHSPQKI